MQGTDNFKRIKIKEFKQNCKIWWQQSFKFQNNFSCIYIYISLILIFVIVIKNLSKFLLKERSRKIIIYKTD